MMLDKLFEENREAIVNTSVKAFAVYLVLKLLQWYGRGPKKGTNNLRRLDGRYVAITGNNNDIDKAIFVTMVWTKSPCLGIAYVSVI